MARVPTKRRARGFLLPIALIFLFILLLLLANLVYLQQTQRTIYQQDLAAFERRTLFTQTSNQVGLALAGQKGPVLGTVNLNQAFESKSESGSVLVRWAQGESMHRPVAEAWASFENLFRKTEQLPSAAYADTLDSGTLKVAPDKTLVRQHADGKVQATIYSAGFPWGAYAPHGNVKLTSAESWTNPSLKESQDENYERFTGLPVNIWAQGGIKVTGSYPVGRASSIDGPIQLPKESSAIGFSGQVLDENYSNLLRKQIENNFPAIAANSIDKTHIFDDAVLSVDGLIKVFKGERRFDSILSVGQATKVPFFPVPAIQNNIVLVVFALHHPWPVDFSGRKHSAENSKKLGELSEKLQELKDELEQLKSELDKVVPGKKEAQEEIERLQILIRSKNSEIAETQKQIDKLLAKKQEDAKNISDLISVSEVPDNAQEEDDQTTDGWSYVKILGNLFQIAVDLLAGKDPMRNLFVPTRVVNLGDQDPDWDWEKQWIKPKGSLTVPRGRTLRFSKNMEVRGDLWLQRGATMHLKGSSLKVSSPGDWLDFNGKEVSANDVAAYPTGRIIMEPGSTLLVERDLEVTGGSLQLGSVLLVSPIGPVRAIDHAILVQGNVKIAHGIQAGMGLDDLALALAENDKAMGAFVKDFLTPVMVEVFPFISRFPYVGPWQWRKCWFASYATTFEFFPELIVAPGPYPIPLPYPNCLTKVFKVVSIAYSAELNFTSGENLYMHSPFWIFGRGVVPVLSKTDPELIRGAFLGIKWEKVIFDNVKEQALDFLEDLLPELAKSIIKEVIQEVFVTIVKQVVPFVPPTCGGGKAVEEAPEKIKDVLKRYLVTHLKESGKGLYNAFRLAIQQIRLDVYSHINDEAAPHSIYRELPGLLLYSGEDMEIGAGGASLVSGLFFAEGNLTSHARRTVGCLISGSGSIEAGALYHYPYYSRASLYNPRKPKDYKISAVDDFFRSAFQYAVPDPEKNTALDIGRTTYHVTAEGWDL